MHAELKIEVARLERMRDLAKAIYNGLPPEEQAKAQSLLREIQKADKLLAEAQRTR